MNSTKKIFKKPNKKKNNFVVSNISFFFFYIHLLNYLSNSYEKTDVINVITFD